MSDVQANDGGVASVIRGSCLCGQIKYELTGGVELINHCHCTMCRKAHGAAFGSFLHAASKGFRWIAGEDLIERYESSPGSLRAFCRVCGSSMPVLEGGDEVNIPAGSLDDDPRRPTDRAHICRVQGSVV